MKHALISLQRHDLYRKCYGQDSEISGLLGECGLKARQTAAKYLDTLAEAGFVMKQQAGWNNYYVNVALVRLFLEEAGGR